MDLADELLMSLRKSMFLTLTVTNNGRSLGLCFFFLQVYSQVKNVLRVDLYDTNTEEDIHINQLLIDEGFAMYQEESHISKVIQLASVFI